MRLGACSFLLPLLGLLGPACGGSEPSLQGVVVIVLDTVRADRLGCYGYDRPTSPRLDALASEGIRFEQVAASSSWTLPSMTSLFAAGSAAEAFQDGKLTQSVVDSLHAGGIHTAAFTEGGFVSRHFGFDLGFDTWTEEEGPVQLRIPGRTLGGDGVGGIESTIAQAEEWLQGVGDQRFFLLLHSYEPHTPYTHDELAGGLEPGRFAGGFTLEHQGELEEGRLELTAAEVEYVAALYDGDIAHTDRHVGRLLDRIEALGLADRVAIVVTSDHGEELGGRYPRNRFDHGHSLLDGLVLVPLILHDPTRSFPVSQVDSQVRLFDLLPTVADLLEVPLSAPVEGRSLVPLMEGKEDADRVAVIGDTKGGPPRTGVRALGMKYVRVIEDALIAEPMLPEPPAVQLYDLSTDPGEVDNLAASRPQAVEAFEQLLEEHTQESGAPAVSPQLSEDIDPKLLERLRSLGYVR